MAPRPKKSKQVRLEDAQEALDNVMNNSTEQARYAQFGYDATKMNEGVTLLNAARAKSEAKKTLDADYHDKSAQVQADFAIARDTYQALSDTAQTLTHIIPDIVQQLGMTAPMARDLPTFLTQAITAFDNLQASDAIKAAFLTRSYDAAKLTAERAKIEKLQADVEAQHFAQAESEQGTQDANEAQDELDSWIADFDRLARVVNRGKKANLKKVNVRTHLTKTKAQRAAPKKAAATRAAKKNKT